MHRFTVLNNISLFGTNIWIWKLEISFGQLVLYYGLTYCVNCHCATQQEMWCRNNSYGLIAESLTLVFVLFFSAFSALDSNVSRAKTLMIFLKRLFGSLTSPLSAFLICNFLCMNKNERSRVSLCDCTATRVALKWGPICFPSLKKGVNVMHRMKVIYWNYKTNVKTEDRFFSFILLCVVLFRVSLAAIRFSPAFIFWFECLFFLLYFWFCRKCIGRSSSLRNPSTPPD